MPIPAKHHGTFFLGGCVSNHLHPNDLEFLDTRDPQIPGGLQARISPRSMTRPNP